MVSYKMFHYRQRLHMPENNEDYQINGIELYSTDTEHLKELANELTEKFEIDGMDLSVLAAGRVYIFLKLTIDASSIIHYLNISLCSLGYEPYAIMFDKDHYPNEDTHHFRLRQEQ
jgi:hypothetical protein